MCCPILTIDIGKVSIEAIMRMRTNHIRRLPVVDNGKVIGIASLMSLIGNVPVRNIELAQLEVPESDSSVTCPYDGSKLRDKNELSKHIDRVHLGSGLLEGDVRKF